MSEMEPFFAELIDTLSQAQLAVQDELETLLRPQERNKLELLRLSETVSSFSAQADGLLVTMMERDAPDEMIDTAETLVDFFHHTKVELIGLLRVGQGSG